jgi:hypothetical protein
MNSLRGRFLLRALIIFVALAGALLIYGATAPIEINQPISDGRTIDLQPDLVVAQSFIAYFPGLNRISLQVEQVPAGTYDEIAFWLNTGLPGSETNVLQPSEVRVEHEQGWIHIHFPPQHYDPFRRFVFYISSYASEPISILANSDDMYPQGSILYGYGDLVFEAGFRPSALELPGIMLSRLKYGKPGLAGAGWLYVLILIGMSASLMMLVETTLRAWKRD